MARLTDIRLRRSAVSGSIPSTSNLNLGELALNTADGKLYMKKSVGGTDSVVEIGGSGGGISATFTAFEYTATSSQTSFSGSDNYSNTLAYNTGTPPKVQVFMNGILLDEGSSADYTATNGTSVVLTSAATAGDLVQIHAYKSDVSVVSNISLADNQKIQFGDENDLQIYHDSNNSYIKDQGTGQLVIDGNAVILQYSSATKLTTTSTGINVTGNIAVSGTVDGIDIAARDAILTSTTTTAGAALPKAGGAMTGAITTNSTFDGRDVATDGTKLDTIETSATADQTQAEINALGITATGLSGTPNIGVGTISSGNITTTGYLRGPSTFTIDPAAHGDDTGTVVIAGNLQIDGTTTTINSTTLDVDDLNITVAKGAANSAAANGGGLTIDGAGASMIWDHTNSYIEFNKPVFSSHSFEVGTTSTKVGKMYNASGVLNLYAYSGRQIAFSNATNGEHVRIDADGNVGIGTASPDRQLEVEGQGVLRLNATGSNTDPGIDFNTASANDMQIRYRGTTDKLAIYSYGTSSDVVTIQKSDGNVGIGTTSPSNPITADYSPQVIGNLTASNSTSDWNTASAVMLRGASGSNGLGFGVSGQANDRKSWIQSGHPDQQYSNYFGTLAINPMGGNVGIGTSSPAVALHAHSTVEEVIRVDSGNTGAIHFFEGSTRRGIIGYSNASSIASNADAGDMVLRAESGKKLHLAISATSKMVVNSSGDVGIGTTAPAAKLDVKGDGADIFLQSNDFKIARIQPRGTGANLDRGLFSLFDQSTEAVRIDSDGSSWINGGDFGIGTTSPGYDLDILDTSTASNTGAGVNIAHATQPQLRFTQTSGNYRMYLGIRTNDLIISNDSGAEKVRFEQNGNVGIGTNSPLDLLHIKSTSTDARQVIDGHTGYDAELKFAENGTVKYTIGHDAASDNFVIGTTNVDTQQRLVINSAGNVGIGVTSIPSWANLMTDGTVAVGGTLYMKTSNAIQALSAFPGGASDLKMQTGGGKVTIGGPGGSTTGHLELYGRYSGSDPKLSFRSDHPTSGNNTVWDMARITADDGGNYNGVLHFQVAAGSGSLNNGAALATAMTIQDTKYVGIGTTNPDTNLEVDIQNGADGNGIHITSTSTTNDPTLKLTRNGSADRFQLMVRGGAGSARLGISAGTNLDSGLNLGSNNGLSIGTTTAAPAGGILSDNDIKSNSRFGVGSGGSLSDAAIYKNSDTNTGIYWPGTDQIALTTAGSSRLHINSSGGVSLGTQSQLTTGGAARLSIIDSSVQLSMGASNSDMSYIRKNGTGQFAWQTYNSGNSGILQLQPYGGNVTINTTAAVSGHALSVSGKIGGLTYVDSYVQFTGGNAILKANDDVVIGYSSYVYVKQAGKVGLGTSDPKAEFQVYHAGIDTYAVNTSATSAAQVDTFSSTEFRSARFTVQITNTTDSTYQITEILLIHDGTTPSMTEYSTIFTGSAREASFDADIVSSNVRLLATPASTDSMQFKVVRHSILV